MEDSSNITVLLNEWSEGNDRALDRLSPLVYAQLHKAARVAFRREAHNHTLQPTALVNEVFLKLVDNDIPWQSRAHFYALTARMMRRLLINHAHERNAAKRGGDQVRVEFDENRGAGGSQPLQADLLALDEALRALAAQDSRKAELVELQYFAGLTFGEMEAVTGLSSSTLDRELRFARAWMKNYLATQ
jgi:RNA polymerase sigma factor (TIGR02999 family)